MDTSESPTLDFDNVWFTDFRELPTLVYQPNGLTRVGLLHLYPSRRDTILGWMVGEVEKWYSPALVSEPLNHLISKAVAERGMEPALVRVDNDMPPYGFPITGIGPREGSKVEELLRGLDEHLCQLDLRRCADKPRSSNDRNHLTLAELEQVIADYFASQESRLRDVNSINTQT